MIEIKVEPFFDCIHELQTFFPDHWEELGIFKDKMPLLPNWPQYAALESIGELLTIVARKNNKVIGYYVCRIGFAIHNASTPVAQSIMMWIDKNKRHHGIGIKLFEFVEDELKRRGIKVWYSNSIVTGKNHKSMDRLLQWMEFKPVDLYYGKWIG
jgi:GNAT superfamily N-acetyltransferase